MGELINGRTPEEIKRILSLESFDCSNIDCPDCEYIDICKRVSVEDCAGNALALIERLESERDAVLEETEKQKTLAEMNRILLEEAAKFVPEWISVKERLPEKDGEYLVLKVHNYRKDDGWMAQEVALFLRTRDPEWVVGNLCEVTHWMPLPEPPTGIEAQDGCAVGGDKEE